MLSLYSIITITFIISVTVGILILSGWRLNILESIVFSVAAGLSADFTLHYSVAYQTSLHKNNRVERVKGALSHIGPAILMGACTTFIAGKYNAIKLFLYHNSRRSKAGFTLEYFTLNFCQSVIFSMERHI